MDSLNLSCPDKTSKGPDVDSDVEALFQRGAMVARLPVKQRVAGSSPAVGANSEKVIRWRRRLKGRIVEAMGGSCQACGYGRCHEALEMHHLDASEKEFGFSKLRASPRAATSLVTELKKCVLLCSNCHREVHAGVLEVPAASKRFDEALFLALVKRDPVMTPAAIYQRNHRAKVRASRPAA